MRYNLPDVFKFAQSESISTFAISKMTWRRSIREGEIEGYTILPNTRIYMPLLYNSHAKTDG
jgi:hypothetical protein